MNTIVVLPDKLDNGSQQLLADALEFCFDGDVWFDGSGVDFIGARCLELMISSAKGVVENGGTVGVLSPSDKMTENLAMLGVDISNLFQPEGGGNDA